MEERKFRPRIRIKDSRKTKIQYKSAKKAYDSPLAKAVRDQKRKKHADYKPPIHGSNKK